MILWLNPVSGISGDMLLGALVDLGARLDDIRAAVSATGIDGSSLEVERVSVNGLNAASVRVAVEEDTTVRTVAEVFEMIDRVTPRPVAELAGRAMHAIAEVESGVHGVPLDELHLHELGSDDTVVDLVGVAAALHILGVEQVLSTPVRLGSGVVNSQHGRLPAPAPATLALLEGMTVESCSISGETVTPTGAALLRAVGCRFGDTPSMVVHKTGYGAGTSRFPNVPNVLVATLCSPATAESSADTSMVLVETTVDDVSGEYLAYSVQALLDAGAADAWLNPVIGKKGRPAHIVSALCAPAIADSLEARLLRETGSLGARRTRVHKTSLVRHFDTVEIDGQPVRIKSGPNGRKPEYEDIKEIARARGVPLRVIADLALARHSLDAEAGRFHTDPTHQGHG